MAKRSSGLEALIPTRQDPAAAARRLRHPEDADMMPELQAAAIRRPSRLATWALAAVGGGLITFFVTASIVPLDEVTRADGKVIPSGQTQVVAHLYGGIVEDILVREGEVVNKGQVLLRIDNRDAQADFGETGARLAALVARAARLEAEAQGQSEVSFPAAALKDSPDATAREKQLFDARRRSLDSELKGLAEQLRQREQELKQQEAFVSSLEKKLASLRSELGSAYRAGVKNVGRLEILRLQRETKDAEGELATERLKVPRNQAAILEARQKIADRMNVFRAEARRDLNDTQSEIARLKEKLQKLTFDVNRNEVRAPLRGIVKQLRIATRGGVVKAGEPLVEITPLDESLVIEGRVRPNDIAFVRVGQHALVKITAYNYATYGGLEGRVTEISPDAIELPEKPGETYYRVKLRTDRSFLEADGKKLPIGPGMTAQVSIKIGEKSLLAYILKPITKTTRHIKIDEPPRPPAPGRPSAESL
ncbi:MAG: HlyD family type I secretion periplasmic adaptor subunit [Rhodospirillaceae bacterium]|nr:HlyD family type I secretion periplasmic adaptor subunit [Rhodospirillaceae bacterium]